MIKKDSESIVKPLLIKYSLNDIPKYKSFPMPIKKIIDGRKNRISLLKRRKVEKKLETHEPKFYLLKKIMKILKNKQICQLERYPIINHFIKELPADRKITNNYGNVKKLFHWLSCSTR